ncbi:MAG: hypothetical protein WBB19_11675 [Desulforhopalus sp.]
MSQQLIHCCVLLYIIFVIAEIRNVLLFNDPRQPSPITIWEEVQQPADSNGYSLFYKG